MANYAGALQMLIWVEAENQEDANKKINLMIDNWDKATPDGTIWDSVDYRLEIEKEFVI